MCIDIQHRECTIRNVCTTEYFSSGIKACFFVRYVPLFDTNPNLSTDPTYNQQFSQRSQPAFILLRIFYNKTIHKLVLKSNSRKILDWAPLGSVYPYTVRETRIPGEAPLVLNQTSILKSYRLFSLERIWDQWIRKILMI